MDCPCSNGTYGKSPARTAPRAPQGMKWGDRGGQWMWVKDSYCLGTGRVQCDLCGGSGRVPC